VRPDQSVLCTWEDQCLACDGCREVDGRLLTDEAPDSEPTEYGHKTGKNADKIGKRSRACKGAHPALAQQTPASKARSALQDGQPPHSPAQLRQELSPVGLSEAPDQY
jgi:hypothetical protein